MLAQLEYYVLDLFKYLQIYITFLAIIIKFITDMIPDFNIYFELK